MGVIFFYLNKMGVTSMDCMVLGQVMCLCSILSADHFAEGDITLWFSYSEDFVARCAEGDMTMWFSSFLQELQATLLFRLF
jgi:hypothetical protein